MSVSLAKVLPVVRAILLVGAAVGLLGAIDRRDDVASAGREPSTVVTGRIVARHAPFGGNAAEVFVLSDPKLAATIADDGSFRLENVPAGTATLVFASGWTERGRIALEALEPAQEVAIELRVISGEIVLVGEARRAIASP